MPSYVTVPTIEPATVVAAISIGAATLSQMAEVFGTCRDNPLLVASVGRAVGNGWVVHVSGTLDAWAVVPQHAAMPPTVRGEG